MTDTSPSALNDYYSLLEKYSHSVYWFNYQRFYAEAATRPDWFDYAEVGVWKGHSVSFLNRMCLAVGKGRHRIVAVDRWDSREWRSFERAYWGDCHPDQRAILGGREQVRQEIERLSLRDIAAYNIGDERHVVLHQGLSAAAAAEYANGGFDFVFIDASHDFASVSADIAAWLPKVRGGGRLAGHDWRVKKGVPKAVLVAAERYGLGLRVDEGQWVWWFDIPVGHGDGTGPRSASVV